MNDPGGQPTPTDRADGWPRVVCLGEVLVDFVALDADVPVEVARTFRRAPGGAPANVAVALSRLDTTAAFLGKVGDDAFGRSLRQTLSAEGVDVRGLVEDPTARTALAFVGSDRSGGRTFVFYHAGMADTLLRPDEIDRELIAHAAIFHFGSVTLASAPSADATLSAAQFARQHGCLVSFDPNVRLELWDSPLRAHKAIVDGLRLSDVVKLSSDELEFVTGTTDPRQASARLRVHGPKMVVLTLGSDGCYFSMERASGRVPGVPVDVVDTLGAGDAFVAGLLAGLAAESPVQLMADESAMYEALRFANAVGALTTTQYGAIPALPRRAQVEQVLHTQPAPATFD